MKVHGDSLTIEIAGANVTIPAPAIAELWLEKVRAPERARLAELLASEERTAIGTLGVHGIYAGIARGPEEGDDHILEVIEREPDKRLSWQDAMKWAESVGGVLPTRREAALLFANVPELFDSAAYWTCEQYAGYEASAWYQGFHDGLQSCYPKYDELRARAVRRLTLK